VFGAKYELTVKQLKKSKRLMVTVKLFPFSRAALNFDESLAVNSYLIWHILSWNKLILIKTKIY